MLVQLAVERHIGIRTEYRLGDHKGHRTILVGEWQAKSISRRDPNRSSCDPIAGSWPRNAPANPTVDWPGRLGVVVDGLTVGLCYKRSWSRKLSVIRTDGG